MNPTHQKCNYPQSLSNTSDWLALYLFFQKLESLYKSLRLLELIFSCNGGNDERFPLCTIHEHYI